MVLFMVDLIQGPIAKYSKSFEKYLSVVEYLHRVSIRACEKEGEVLAVLKKKTK
jgi:hypothetical protein